MFGFGIDPEAFVMDFLAKLPKLDSVDGRMVMQDLYETKYGIWNHLDKTTKRPLASVAFHECEDINEGSLLEEAIRAYTSKNIGDFTKLSLVDFLDLPIDIVAMIIKICDEASKKKEKTFDEIERSMIKPRM